MRDDYTSSCRSEQNSDNSKEMWEVEINGIKILTYASLAVMRARIADMIHSMIIGGASYDHIKFSYKKSSYKVVEQWN